MYLRTPARLSKRTQSHADLMLKIATSLELLLARNIPPEQAAQDWQNFEAALLQTVKRRRVRTWLFLAIFVVFVAVVVSLALISSH